MPLDEDTCGALLSQKIFLMLLQLLLLILYFLLLLVNDVLLFSQYCFVLLVCLRTWLGRLCRSLCRLGLLSLLKRSLVSLVGCHIGWLLAGQCWWSVSELLLTLLRLGCAQAFCSLLWSLVRSSTTIVTHSRRWARVLTPLVCWQLECGLGLVFTPICVVVGPLLRLLLLLLIVGQLLVLLLIVGPLLILLLIVAPLVLLPLLLSPVVTSLPSSATTISAATPLVPA